MARRITVAIIAVLSVTLGTLVLGVSPAGAGEDLALNIKKKSGPYAREVQANIAPGKAKDFTLKVTGAPDLEFDVSLIEGDPDDTGYKTKYFRNDNNISSEVKAAGFLLDLGADGKQKFRMKVKVTSESPPDPFCRDVDAVEQGNSALVSTVIARLNGSMCKF